MTDEEKKAIETIEELLRSDEPICEYMLKHQEIDAMRSLLHLIEKQSKEIEELKREKETNQQMIYLAETQILGYGQGYKDGLNKETTAIEIVARERENQIIYEGIKHKINMEWVLKIKAKIEEIDEVLKGQLIEKIRVYFEAQKEVLQSLLEKE